MNAAGQATQVLDAALDRVAALDARYLVPAIALQLIAFACKAVAWRNVLAAAFPATRVSFVSVGCSYAAGMGLNAFLPARGGDAVKVALVRAQVPRSTVAGIVTTLGVVSLLDAFVGATLVGALWLDGALPMLPVPRPGDHLPLLAAASVIVAAILGAAAAYRPETLRRILANATRGAAVLRTPGRYVRSVVPFQLAAWACRIAVLYLVLAAFGIHTSVGTAALLVVVGGISTAVPVPGGAGAQQVLAVYALQGMVSAAGAISFSVGFQVGLTILNTAIGLVGAMVLFRTSRPLAALGQARAAARQQG